MNAAVFLASLEPPAYPLLRLAAREMVFGARYLWLYERRTDRSQEAIYVHALHNLHPNDYFRIIRFRIMPKNLRLTLCRLRPKILNKACIM